jgi:hypothetical protein
MKKDFIANMLGDIPPGVWASYIIFACLGIFITLLHNAVTRKPTNDRTPLQFSHRFLLRDNWKRLLLSFCSVLVTIRFFGDISGSDISCFKAFGTGMCCDIVAQILFMKGRSVLPVSEPEPVANDEAVEHN